MLPKPHNESNLQTMRFFKVRFWPKSGAFLQKNRGPTEIILHFFLYFPCFLGSFSLLPLAPQPLAPLQPLPKKSCLKTYRRFFVPSVMGHNRRVNVELTGRNALHEPMQATPPLKARPFGGKSRKSPRHFAAGPPPKSGRTEVNLALSKLTGLNLIALNLT